MGLKKSKYRICIPIQVSLKKIQISLGRKKYEEKLSAIRAQCPVTKII